MKIAMIQMAVQERNKSTNVAHGLELLEEAVQGCDVAVMPEIWTTGYSLGNLQEEAETLNGPVVKAICVLAKTHKCNIVAGSLPLKLAGKIYNMSLTVDRNGNIISHYGKLHLFSLFKEEAFFTQGKAPAKYKLDEIACSTTICYDLRFPELYRYLALSGTLIFFTPAEWPTERKTAWRLFNQARAMENHAFGIGVNCVGSFRGAPFYGHSMVVAPSGEILLEAGDQEGIFTVAIDLQEIARVREKINVLNDVRRDIWR